MRLVLVCLTLLAVVRPAHARSVGVVVTGDEMLQTPLRAQLEMWLRAHGHDPVASPLEPDAVNALVDCFVMEDLACAQKVVEQKATKADAVLYARAESVANGKGRDITLVMHYFVKGHPESHERRVCESCSDDAMRATADALVTIVVPAEAPKAKPVPPGPENAIFVRQSARRSRMVPALVTGTGVAALIAGGVFYVTSEKDDGTQLYYRDTKPLGIGLGIGGAVLIGTGVILLLRDSPRDNVPTAAIIPHGGVVGWAGVW